MKSEYLFLLESYCFIWKDCNHILLYNTFSGKGYVYENLPALSDFVDQLLVKENLYSVPISSIELSNKAVADFIYSARNNFCGDLFSKAYHSGKPIVIIPEVNINEDVNRNLDDINSSAVFGSTVLKNLTDIYLELGGKCQSNCLNCNSVYKQIEWCYASDKVMSFEIVKKIFEEIKYANVFDIHFVGGNILDYPFWDDLIVLISSCADDYSCNVNFCVNVKHLQEIRNRKRINDLLAIKNVYLKVYFEIEDMSKRLDKSILETKDKIEFICKVVNEEQVLLVSDYFEKLNVKFDITPYYTGENICFFEKYVFMNIEDILNTSLSKKDIFSHQLVNTNHFGKLYVKANGDVCSNINGNSLGCYNEGLHKFVYKELKEGTFWRKTRDLVEPCRTCLFKYLCPSPSKYEEMIGKFNLCHVKE